jgi:L-lactate dehydrogenase (cytochrome)
MQTEGEVAGARAAARHGIPFSLSTLGTASIEAVAAANPQGRNWFQLYMWKDRDQSMALVKRAAEAGFDLLTTEPLSFASLDRWPGTVAEYLDTMFDPSLPPPADRRARAPVVV